MQKDDTLGDYIHETQKKGIKTMPILRIAVQLTL